MHQQVLETKEKKLKPKYPDILTSISNLKSVLKSQDKYKKAETIY